MSVFLPLMKPLPQITVACSTLPKLLYQFPSAISVPCDRRRQLCRTVQILGAVILRFRILHLEQLPLVRV